MIYAAVIAWVLFTASTIGFFRRATADEVASLIEALVPAFTFSAAILFTVWSLS